MRTLAVLALAACGSQPAARDATPDDAAIPDAPLPVCGAPTAGTTVTFRPIADVGNPAVLVTAPPDDPRLFVIEQRGVIRVIEDGQLLATPFLDLRDEAGGPVVDGGELGLLGLAFDPAYATTGELYVAYTSLIRPGDNDPIDNLARYHVSADRNVADPAGTLVLALRRTRPNHNGGMIEFGADGLLYLGTGDGGSHGDPLRYAQDPRALHGKMLRLDVHQRTPPKQYGIPAGNPFADGVAGAPEVFMLGLRNPWRWSFDRGTGDLWIGDVGQGQTEELDVARAGDQAGKNFGWSAYEGTACCATQADLCTQAPPQQACDPAGKTFALDNRPRASGWASIIGGQVYRGACYPDLVGTYFYTDFVKGGLAQARLRSDGTLDVADLPGTYPAQPTSLHADAYGELYETDATGKIYHLEVAAP